MNELIQYGKEVIESEIDALRQLSQMIDEQFAMAVDKLYECEGRIIITGVGKSGHIAGKIAATMSSLGKPSFCVHPDDALHGDLGMITSKDVVILISNSGESDELLMMIPNLRTIGAYLIAMTANEASRLAENCDMVCLLPHTNEACALNMAPTSSTTVSLVYGDALCVSLSRKMNFTKSNFAQYHPAGALGKKLTMTVRNLMHKSEEEKLCVLYSDSLKEAVLMIGSNRTGAVAVTDESGSLKGIVTNGDIRRVVEKGLNIYDLSVENIMTKSPVSVVDQTLAIQALALIKDKGISSSVLPVVNKNNKVVGMITIYDIVKAGISE